MALINDELLSRLAVRLKRLDSHTTIGSGIIYFEKKFKDKIYILTAAHCLFEDKDNFQNIFQGIEIDIYCLESNSYKTIAIKAIDMNLLFKDIDKDIAVLLLDKAEVEKLIGEIIFVDVVQEKYSHNSFVIKGFPNATQGKELDVIFPTWKQNTTEVFKFQLQLNEDYTGWAMEGFSGSGVFLEANDELYLYGLFTRFREEEKGKVIYCQFIKTVNELLDQNYLPTITISFFGENGLNQFFFQRHIEKSIEDLGPRFSKKLNFKLRIARLFNDISKDELFKSRFLTIIDKWLIKRTYYSNKNNAHLDGIEKEQEILKQKTLDWISTNPIDVNRIIDINWLNDGINQINNKIREQIEKLYDLRRSEEKTNADTKKDYSYRPPYEDEIYRLREFERGNNDFIYSISEDVNINLSNHPFLIIKGEAGCGKSHLLGDIVSERIKQKTPSILLLGQKFNNSKSIEQNIIEQLGIGCNFQQLLISLNNIGIQIGYRVLILIDAINEGAGADLWRNGIAGFINDVSKFPFIGLVLTIRDTYFDFIIPDNVKNNSNIQFVTHEGFKGNEYAALKLFCEFYELKQPNFPILAPEFTSPLFLQLICDGVKYSKEKIFPKGFQGVKKVFEMYSESLKHKFSKKRDEYKYKNVVIDAIHRISFACFKNEMKYLTIQEVNLLLITEFPQHQYLLVDLIEESVLIKNIITNYRTEQKEEVIYFAYQRFGDFFIADDLLNRFENVDDIKVAFQKENEFGKFIKDLYWQYRGVLEAFSVLLPERFGLEIFEVYEWVFKEEEQSEYRGDTGSWLNHFLVDSLKWRTVQSIDDEKITNWINGQYFRMDDDQWLLKWIEFTTIENHPFNSDRLYHFFKRMTMAERDGFWQLHLYFYKGFDDDKNAFPIRRLIDWAWTTGISKQLDFGTARLTAQTLVWVLSTTNKKLRDETTKALVNLLEQQPNVLLVTLKAFEDIDDLYILERLFAVAYGCVLRTEQEGALKKIAQYTFDKIFKNETPPAHILLRDYARNIIEYAIYKGIQLEIEEKLIKPPYKSKMPYLPTDSEIKEYNLDHNAFDFEKDYNREYNQIYFSVMSWDFGQKVVKPIVKDFQPIRFTQENEYKSYLKGLEAKQRKIIKSISESIEIKNLLVKNKYQFENFLGEEKYKKQINDYEQKISMESLLIDEHFSKEQAEYVKHELIPYIEIKHKIKSNAHTSFESKPIRRWIVKRSFELGYDKNIHGRYDSTVQRHNDRGSSKVERIGKKYQWIAYYEILGMLTDNYKLKEGWSADKKGKFYKGPWQLYLRNIDPAFITKDKVEDDDIDDSVEILVKNEENWWTNEEYKYWNLPNDEWVEKTEDLPNPVDIILKKDTIGNEWLYLERFVKWNEPKPIGTEKYNVVRKEIWYLIQGYLVNNKDVQKAINHLKNKNFWGRWMPENRDNYTELFNREKFWSPAYLDEGQERKWENVRGANYKVIIATTEAKGNIGEDNSGANFKYNIPCKTIFEGMDLQYAPIDGDFTNNKGEIVVTNINTQGVLIKKDELLQFLQENDLDIIWTVLGEKLAFLSMGDYHYFRVPCGVFYFDNGKLVGELKSFKRD